MMMEKKSILKQLNELCREDEISFKAVPQCFLGISRATEKASTSDW